MISTDEGKQIDESDEQYSNADLSIRESVEPRSIKCYSDGSSAHN
jgi:hypothetical protein